MRRGEATCTDAVQEKAVRLARGAPCAVQARHPSGQRRHDPSGCSDVCGAQRQHSPVAPSHSRQPSAHAGREGGGADAGTPRRRRGTSRRRSGGTARRRTPSTPRRTRRSARRRARTRRRTPHRPTRSRTPRRTGRRRCILRVSRAATTSALDAVKDVARRAVDVEDALPVLEEKAVGALHALAAPGVAVGELVAARDAPAQRRARCASVGARRTDAPRVEGEVRLVAHRADPARQLVAPPRRPAVRDRLEGQRADGADLRVPRGAPVAPPVGGRGAVGGVQRCG